MFIENRIAALTATMEGLNDSDRATVQNTINELTEVLNSIDAAILSVERGEGETAAIKAKIEEVSNAVKDVKAAMKQAVTTANKLSDLSKGAAFRKAFAECVKNTVEPREFKAAWREKVNEMMVANGISETNITNGDFLPGFIVNEINDRFVGRRHRILELVDWTGLPMFKALNETAEDLGHVHTRGTAKTEQNLEFSPVEIRPDYIYKYLTVDQLVLRETRDMDDVLYRFIVAELLDRLLQTVENLIVTGTAPFLPATEVTAVSGMFEAGYYMDDSDGAIAIMSKQKYYEIKQSLNTMTGNGGRLATHDDVLSYLGVEEVVFNSSVFTPSSGTWAGILYMSPRDYKMVGDRRPDQYEDFNLAYNKREFLMEIYAGGGCVRANQFVALVNA